jgi:hypothetical protein
LRRMEMTQSFSYFHATPSPTPSSVASICTHPRDLTNDATLTIAEKRRFSPRGIRARGRSRMPPLCVRSTGAVVPLDEIREALVSLDEPRVAGRETQSHRLLHFERRRGVVTKGLRRISSANRSHDDDDNPPPAPAGLGKAFGPTFVAAHGQVAWKSGPMVPGR